MRFYLMGICGTAMGNAALLLKEQGHAVCGADSGIYPPMSEVLSAAGIEVFDGYDAARLAGLKPDRVVVGNAMSRGNVEVEWLLDQSEIPFVSLPQLFHETVLPQRRPIVITGTHGKTTTSALTAFLLDAAGAEPGWLIGGVPRDLHSGANLGKGDAFVIEGDEYDSAFFDKRSKFIHYRPYIAVLNNLEFDHADIFRDLEDVLRTFRHFLRIIPGSGCAIVNGDDANIASLLPIPWTRTLRVGTGAENDLMISNFTDGAEGSAFDLHWKGQLWERVRWPMHGLFNARNVAMAALAAALSTGCETPVKFGLAALSRFRGVRRRQDVLHSDPRWTVLEDFAHHPTAVEGALIALRAAYPGKRLYACFEPRSNTAATSLFQEAFTRSLGCADRIYLGAVHRAETMDPAQRLDTTRMATELAALGRTARAFPANADLIAQIRGDIQEAEGGVWVFFSNGSFDGVAAQTAGCLKESFA